MYLRTSSNQSHIHIPYERKILRMFQIFQLFYVTLCKLWIDTYGSMVRYDMLHFPTLQYITGGWKTGISLSGAAEDKCNI